jgi:hypothetical protein
MDESKNAFNGDKGVDWSKPGMRRTSVFTILPRKAVKTPVLQVKQIYNNPDLENEWELQTVTFPVRTKHKALKGSSQDRDCYKSVSLEEQVFSLLCEAR